MPTLKETIIDGVKVMVQKHPTMRGLQLKARVMRGAQIMLGLFAPGVTEEQEPLIVSQGLAGLTPVELTEFITELLALTSVVVPDRNGTMNVVPLSSQAMIDNAFDERDDMLFFRVVAFALKVNLLGFIAGISSALGTLAIPTDKTSPSPTK